MSYIHSPNLNQIQKFIDENKYTQLISYLKTCQLESLTNTSIISKLIERLACQSNYLILIYFLSFLVDYPLEVFQKEINDAIGIILKHSDGIETNIYDLLIKYINRKRLLDSDVIINFISTLFNKQTDKVSIIEQEQYYNLVFEYISYNKDHLTHSFWEKVIQIFHLNGQQQYEMKLLKLYPLKYSLSESYWKKLIEISKDLMLLYNVFNEKYNDRQACDNIDSYIKIFNVFIRQIGFIYGEEINDNTAMTIFNSIIDNKIHIEEESLSIFIMSYTKANISSLSSIVNVLIKASTNMTSKIASDVINLLYAEKEMETIVVILKLIKKRDIIAEFDSLNINKDVMKKITLYIINNCNTKSVYDDLKSQIENNSSDLMIDSNASSIVFSNKIFVDFNQFN